MTEEFGLSPMCVHFTYFKLKSFIIVAYWHYVQEHLNSHELERYRVLKHVDTDAGRGRAWLRSALNEHSLEKYMHMLVEDTHIIRCRSKT